MNNTPLISTIVPCYNQAQYLDECLQSVLDQTYENWECIIVNDGSPDNTEEVAKRWIERDSRFKYLKKENGGLSSARNAGIEIAQGEWFQFLDCDDKIDADKFNLSSLYFNHYDVVITNYQLFSENNLHPDYCSFIDENLSFEDILLKWDSNFSIPIHCALFKKLKDKFHFQEVLKAKEDFVFWLHFFENNPKYIIINKRHAFYRIHQESMTKNYALMLENETLAQKYIIRSFDTPNINVYIFQIIERTKQSLLNLKEQNQRLSIENTKLKNSRYFIYKTKVFNLLKSFR
ncbi:glycosyltransferase family 2 protein [Chryseobacterium oryzae]|uniref:Glycosyltransferase n=1 Tax=Chryseobacterium oryzae TaxID=2929799 RepID=A0ABY4BGI0_9FLAO|nr:glycosyltransferase family 2 protein [Chryseobacterium oryzae]UOE38004.1 glycosyltransferase [Chryseobacterium oryzae]